MPGLLHEGKHCVCYPPDCSGCPDQLRSRARSEIDYNDPNDLQYYNLDWRSIRGTPIKLFVCPADSGHDELFTPHIAKGYNGKPPDYGPESGADPLTQSYAGANWARGNYACNMGPCWTDDSAGGMSPKQRNGDGTSGRYKAGGVMTINWGAKLTALANQDGTSNTALLYEVRVGVNKYDRRGVWAMGFTPSSAVAGLGLEFANPNDRTLAGWGGERTDRPQDCSMLDGDEERFDEEFYIELAADGMGCMAEEVSDDPEAGVGNWHPPVIRNGWNDLGNSRSRHPGGVNVVFADGSTRYLRDSVPQPIYFMMSSRNDGLVYHYNF